MYTNLDVNCSGVELCNLLDIYLLDAGSVTPRRMETDSEIDPEQCKLKYAWDC